MRILLIIMGVSALLYSPVLGLGFVSDDNALITHPLSGISNQTITGIFASDLWHFQDTQSGYYRPVMMLSLLLDSWLFGDQAWGYHLHSLLWHLGCVGMIGLLFGRLLGESRGQLIAGLYAFHPLVSEQVAFISARNDSMALALALGALWFSERPRSSTSSCLTAAFLAAAACLSKETGMVVLCLLPLIDWARSSRLMGWHRYAALVAGITAAYFIREMVGPGLLHTPEMPGAEMVVDMKLPILAYALGKLVWPFPLTDSTHIAYMGDIAPTPAIATGFVIVYLATLGGRWAKVGTFFAVVTLVPGLLAIASRYLIGERYLTLSVLGLAIAVAAITPKTKKTAWMLLLTVPWIVGIHKRLPHWTSDLTLATSAYQASATPYTAAWLGHELYRAQDGMSPLPYFDESTRGQPPTCDFAGEWIRSARELEGIDSALQTARLVWDRQCAAAPGVRGEWALTHLHNHDVESARQILSPLPTSCSPSLALPVITLTLLDGGIEQAKHCAQTSRVPKSVLKPQVDTLLNELVKGQKSPTP